MPHTELSPDFSTTYFIYYVQVRELRLLAAWGVTFVLYFSITKSRDYTVLYITTQTEKTSGTISAVAIIVVVVHSH